MTIEISQIIEDLYEGTLDATAWHRAILSIADILNASGAMLFAFNPSTGVLLRDEQHRVDPSAVLDYARHWHSEDVRIPYASVVPVGQPATEISLGIPLKKSRIYNEFLLAVDTPHFMPVWLHKTTEKIVAISLQGSLKRGPFGAQDIEMLRRFVPHLARTLEIRDRLESAEIRAANLANVLDTATFGVIILDSGRRIIEANAVASALLVQKSGLSCNRDGTLHVAGYNDNRLAKWMLGVETPQAHADALLHVPRDGKLPLSILAVPIPKMKISWLAGDPVWLLLIFDAERRLTLNHHVVMKDLNLSERETRVVSLLAIGLDILQIAERLKVSVNTVRTQLHSAFQKTGCHSQADLTRRILLGPGQTILIP